MSKRNPRNQRPIKAQHTRFSPVLTAVCLTASALAGPGVAGEASPNIVFILADDLGWADTSNTLTTQAPGMSAPDPSDFYQTPALQRIAAEGMAFTNAYAMQNCAPTRAAILSGQYAPRETNNVYQVGDLNRWSNNNTLLVGPIQGLPSTSDKPEEDAIRKSTVTYAETLQSAGYATAHVGKFHVTKDAASILSDHGFDANYGGQSSGGPGAYHASNGTFGNSIEPGLDPYAQDYTQAYVDQNIKPYANGTPASAIDALVGTKKHVTDSSVDAAIHFMEANKTGRFALQFATHAVHSPIGDKQARSDLLAKYEALPGGAEDNDASFGALIEGLDQSVARLIDYLQTTDDPSRPGSKLSDNTLLVFTSDNGGRQNQSNNGPLKGQKGELDEGGIRVPLIFWSTNGDLVDGGTVNHTPVTSVDFYPTFASLASAATPTDYILDGEDLSGMIADAGVDLGRENLFWHLPGYLAQGRDQKPQSVVRHGDMKLLYNYEDQSYELYDLVNDIEESTNLADNDSESTARIATELLHWLDATDAPLATLRSGTLSLQIDGRAYADGQITHYDNQLVVIQAGQEVPFIVDLSGVLAGDFDLSGQVAQADLDLVLLNWGRDTASSGLPEGWIGDQPIGLIGQEELDRVLLNWGGGTGGTSPNRIVPEPATGSVVAVSLLARWRGFRTPVED